MSTATDLLLLFGSRAAAQTYQQIVLAIQAASLIGYYPMNETSGTAMLDQSGNNRNWTYTGATLAQTAGPGTSMGQAPRFDGALDWVAAAPVAFLNAWNGAEHTIAGWMKVSAATIWTDGLTHSLYIVLADGSNYEILRKTSNNTLAFLSNAGGTAKAYNHTISLTTWIHVAITHSKSADHHIVYVNGTSVNDVTTLGIWSGTPIVSRTVLGSDDNSGTQSFNGYLSGFGFWSKALTPTEIATLAVAV